MARLRSLLLPALAASLAAALSIFPPYHVDTTKNHCVDPTKCTCAEMSLSSTNWTAIDFHYSSSSDSTRLSLTSIDFSVVNLAIQNTTHCALRMGKGRRAVTNDDDGGWYQCDTSTHSPVTFRFDPGSGLLELKQDWACERETPSRVWVTGSVKIPMHCENTAAARRAAAREDTSKRGVGMAADGGLKCDMAAFTVPWLEIAASG